MFSTGPRFDLSLLSEDAVVNTINVGVVADSAGVFYLHEAGNVHDEVQFFVVGILDEASFPSQVDRPKLKKS